MDRPEQPVEAVVEPIAMDTRIRDSLVAKLPASWSQKEIDHFLATYYNKIEAKGDFDAPVVEAADTLAEEPESVDTLTVSNESRKGLTLDSYIIIDGRSVTVKQINDAGMLVPFRTVVLEGTRRLPARRVTYAARVVNRPLTLVITEETYKVLSSDYPEKVTPTEDYLSSGAIKNIQAKVRIVEADKLERTFS